LSSPRRKTSSNGGIKRRRCERRDSEEQRDRVIHDRFENYDPIVIANRKNDKGETIADCIMDELQHLKTKGEYFETKFWTKIHLDFKLDVGLFQKLPDISGGGEPNEEIIDALAVAREKTPINALPTASRVNFTIVSRSIQTR
jgi:hypothetical protein